MAFGRRAWLSLMARGTVLAAGARVRAVEGQPTRYAADPRIKHIVVLMLENRSFDNVLGWAYATSRPSHFTPPGSTKRYNGLQGPGLNRWANPVKVGNATVWIPPKRGFSMTSIGGVSYLMPPPVDPNEKFVHMTRQI